MRSWKRLMRVADKAVLVAALLTWWFVLRPAAEVVNLVDTLSYLVMVYSLWRAAGSLAVRARQARLPGRRSEGAGPDEEDRAKSPCGVSPDRQ
jgi:hypothetical protein